jgi:hypothetical protein
VDEAVVAAPAAAVTYRETAAGRALIRNFLVPPAAPAAARL